MRRRVAAMARGDHEKMRFVKRRLEAQTATGFFAAGDHRAATRLASFWDRGRVCGLEVAGGSGRAGGEGDAWQLVAFHDPNPWFGEATTIVFADRDLGSAFAFERLAEAWARPGLHHRHDVWLEIDPRDGELLQLLLNDGLAIDTIITVGRVAEALELAPEVLGDAPFPEGAVLRPLVSADVDAVLELHRIAFSEAPEWCWFGAFPLHLQSMGAAMRAWCDGHGEPGEHWVVEHSGRVAGHVDTGDRPDPGFGRASGIGIVLSPELRGRGLLKSVWRHVLHDCSTKGIGIWRGGSSQPAVLGLGARLGRRWHQIGLRRGGRFQPDHFMRLRPSESS